MPALPGSVLPEITEGSDRTTVRVEYPLPAILAARCSLVWEIFADGRLSLSGSLSCGKGLGVPEIPFVGIEAVFPSPVESFAWYGLGPHENYIDRKRSALLGKYRSTPSSSYVPYLKPQECGNRTGVRSLTLIAPSGARLNFRDSTDGRATFEFSVLPWSREELEKARHFYELGRETKSVLRLGLIQMGVGGDNSWGARTLSDFMPSAENDFRWKVDISFK
jgi:beta-galactosidase